MKYVTKSMNTEFKAIMNRRTAKNGVMLRCTKKNGEFGKPAFYQFFGSENTAEEVIRRMENNNPGKKFVEA